MFAKGKKKGTVQFSLTPAAGAKEVYVAGSFNEWTLLKMKKRKDGSFAADVKLAPGAYDYKFVVDGLWLADPDHNRWAPNPHGTFNSVAQID